MHPFLPRLLLVAASVAASVDLPAQRRSAPRDPFAGVDSVIQAAMKAWKVPGLAVAVTTRDSVIFARGYGVRKLGDPTPVDTRTLFAIGSASKAFTGASLALLTDDKKLGMDDRVIDHLPWFQMYDPWVTRELRLRDLLLHRSGLERGDLSWYSTSRSREEIVRTVRHLPPTTSFRTRFQYQNLMYITAGEVIRQASGMTWDDFVRTRIFTPLGMTASNTSVRALEGQVNVAQPHADLGGIRAIPYRNIDNAGAAGSINSNVEDMSRWIRLWLNGGRAGSQRILSEEMTREAMRSQHTMDDPYLTALLNAPQFPGYAFGWFVAAFRGKRHIGHGGNIDGMATMVGFLPDDGIGVVVLTNMNQTSMTVPLVNHLFDRALGLTPSDDFTPYRAAEEAFMKRLAGAPPAVATGTRPSVALDAYVGTYRHTMFGTATVRLAEGKLSISYDASPIAIGDLAHHQYDTFMATMRDPMMGKVPVTFRIGAGGQVDGVAFPLMGADGEWVRERTR
ncbi:MAG: serine hydrolase [Gemmatimonadetes bacterium]|nr:serine hydrolase [Gemmatimonadota bacterium]